MPWQRVKKESTVLGGKNGYHIILIHGKTPVLPHKFLYRCNNLYAGDR